MASFVTRLITEIEQNDVVEVGFKNWFRCRYITYSSTAVTLHLQPEGEKLSPFVQNDVVGLSVNKDQNLTVRVKAI